MNRKPSEKTEFDMEEETKRGKKPGGDTKLTAGARRKTLYFLWIEKNIEKITLLSKEREVETSQQN